MALNPAVNNYFNQMGQAYGFNPHDANSHGPILGQMQTALSNPTLNPQVRDSLLQHAKALQAYGNHLRGGPNGIRTIAPGNGGQLVDTPQVNPVLNGTVGGPGVTPVGTGTTGGPSPMPPVGGTGRIFPSRPTPGFGSFDYGSQPVPGGQVPAMDPGGAFLNPGATPGPLPGFGPSVGGGTSSLFPGSGDNYNFPSIQTVPRAYS